MYIDTVRMPKIWLNSYLLCISSEIGYFGRNNFIFIGCFKMSVIIETGLYLFRSCYCS